MKRRDIQLTCALTFRIEGVTMLQSGDRKELREFIKDALESWGGQRHPDDWLFGSLENVVISRIEEYHKPMAEPIDFDALDLMKGDLE